MQLKSKINLIIFTKMWNVLLIHWTIWGYLSKAKYLPGSASRYNPAVFIQFYANNLRLLLAQIAKRQQYQLVLLISECHNSYKSNQSRNEYIAVGKSNLSTYYNRSHSVSSFAIRVLKLKQKHYRSWPSKNYPSLKNCSIPSLSIAFF